MNKSKWLTLSGVLILVMGITWMSTQWLRAIPALSEYRSNMMAFGEILIAGLAPPIILFMVPGIIMTIFGFKSLVLTQKTCPNCGNRIEVIWNVCINCAFQLKK
ncbi:MAG: hypothetical protein ACXADU_00040 [Promethearchaeota archaeon]|jgi:hypothetical protein